ncbi:MAG: HD domain-containing protein [Cyclobacteriaceae bacterium]
MQIVRHVSFKGGNFEATFNSPELAVVQDADRLDAIGAIGIARTFHYGGFRNRALYDPDIPPNLTMSKEEYKRSQAPTINHFYEKLLLLKDRMNTDAGRKLAEERHQFMEQFLDQFYHEWG